MCSNPSISRSSRASVRWTMRQRFSGRNSVPPTECSTWNSGWPVPARSSAPSAPVSSGTPRKGDLLLVVADEGPFQDQLVLLRVEPQPLHRAPVQVLAAVAAAPVPGTVAAGAHHQRDVGARVRGLAHLHV